MKPKVLVHEEPYQDKILRWFAGVTAEVHLISMTQNPKKLIALGMRAYTGHYETDIPEDLVEPFFRDSKTALATPLEWVNFVFLLKDVPRFFTHQLVRNRVGVSFVQQSTRNKTEQLYFDFLVPPSYVRAGYRLEDNSDLNKLIQANLAASKVIIDAYHTSHLSAEDARFVLPHNFLTHIYWQTNLVALNRVFDKRFCCQAEKTVWLPVLLQIMRLLQLHCPGLEQVLSSPFLRGESCGYTASFDKPCTWKGKTREELLNESISDSGS